MMLDARVPAWRSWAAVPGCAAERMRPLLRAMLWLCLLAITWLALTPRPDAPGLGWDKLNHAAAFLVLAALADLGWPGRATLPWRLGLLLGYGVLIELVQAVLAYRQGSALDFVADALGVAAYLAVQRGVAMLRRRA